MDGKDVNISDGDSEIARGMRTPYSYELTSGERPAGLADVCQKHAATHIDVHVEVFQDAGSIPAASTITGG